MVGAEELRLPVLMKVPKPVGDEEETAQIMVFIQNNATAYSQFIMPELLR